MTTTTLKSDGPKSDEPKSNEPKSNEPKTDWHYIVCTAEGYRSSDEECDNETYETEAAAEARARELAVLEPGEPIYIYEAISATVAPIDLPVTRYKKSERDR